jgi:hypothetical protein
MQLSILVHLISILIFSKPFYDGDENLAFQPDSINTGFNLDICTLILNFIGRFIIFK